MLDVALQTSGSLEGLMDLAISNGRSVTAELADGEELMTGEVVDRKVIERYEVEGIFPATEASAEDCEAMPWGGIGLMGIEIDFVVS